MPASSVFDPPSTAPAHSALEEESGRRTFAVGSLAAGALVAGLGAWQYIDSAARYAEFEGAYANGARPAVRERERLAELRSSADRSRVIGTVGLGLGAAAIGTGLFLLLKAEEAPPPQASVLVGPSSIGVSVLLP